MSLSTHPPIHSNAFKRPADTTVVSLNAEDFDIPLAQVGRYAGGSKYKLEGKTADLAREALALAVKWAQPVFGYAFWSVSDTHPQQGACLASGYRLPVPEEEQDPLLKGVAAVVCTLGAELDQGVRDLGADGDLTMGLFIDAAGVALLEALGAACQDHIRSVLKTESLFCGCPFGPGYGTTPMGSFQPVFDHVDGTAVGVHPAGEAMMAPLKSVAFWLRVTADPEAVKSQGYKCRRCTMEHCLYRTAPSEVGLVRDKYLD